MQESLNKISNATSLNESQLYKCNGDTSYNSKIIHKQILWISYSSNVATVIEMTNRMSYITQTEVLCIN